LFGTVLVVDDDLDARKVASALSVTLGLKVIEAVDGQEAVRVFALRQSEIALVLRDLTMPIMDGREAFQRIREISPTVPIILSSGYNEQDAVGDLTGANLTGFLPKPYLHHQFEAVIRQALD